MATIYLFRHGQASFGAENYDKLSPLGERQASVLGEYLAGAGIKLDVAYSGGLERQKNTCRLALEGQGKSVFHHIDERFDEVRNDEHIEKILPELVKSDPRLATLMKDAMQNSKNYQKVIDAVFNYWVSPKCKTAGIQTWAEYSGGTKAAIEELMEKEGRGKTIGVFSSGGTIATIATQVLGLDGSFAYKFYEPIINCSITQLFYNGNKISISNFNDYSYLQKTGAITGENLVTYR